MYREMKNFIFMPFYYSGLYRCSSILRNYLLSTGTVLFLTYHRVLPQHLIDKSLSQRSIILSLESFTQQLNLLKKYYDIISLDDFFDLKKSKNNRTKPYAVITFDDGWADNYIYAFETLTRAKCPSVVYLASDYIGSSRLFWPERLSALVSGLAGRGQTTNSRKWIESRFGRDIAGLFESLNAAGEDPARKTSVNTLVIRLKTFRRQQIEALLERLAGESEMSCCHGIPEDRMLTWAEVREMADNGVIIGSHTCSHAVLTDVDADEAISEIVNSKSHIEENIGRPVLDFSYPNGQLSAAVAALVRKAGYRSAVTGLNGLSSFRTDPLMIRRKGNNELRFLGRNGEFSEALLLLEWSDTIGFFRRMRRNPYH